MGKKGADKDTCNVVCMNRELVAKLKRIMPPAPVIEEAGDVFSVLGDATRIKIIFALSEEKELCVCDIANILGLTISAASHQLRRLKDKKTVNSRNDGNMVYYSLADMYIESLLADALKHILKGGR